MAWFSQLALRVVAGREYQYWRHVPTGKVWAVQVQDGVLIGACGPLDPREVPVRILPYLSYHFGDVVWIQDNRRDFTLHVVPHANQTGSRTRP